MNGRWPMAGGSGRDRQATGTLGGTGMYGFMENRHGILIPAPKSGV